MKKNLVTLKGKKEGLFIHIKDGDFELIKKHLSMNLNKAKNFLKGAKVINFIGKELNNSQKDELKSIITEKYGISIDSNFDNINKDSVDNTYIPNSLEGTQDEKTKFIRATIRSGQVIKFNGNLVILGDVNPGAIVKANGNIVVLGRLGGIAHAGCNGNSKAIISAFKIQAKQIRIADIITRSPDDDFLSKTPEIAMIKDKTIIIEPYLHKNII